jgi:hypothetical protein
VTDERALTTLDVDDALVERKSAQLMKHAGGGIFPSNMTQPQAVALARLALAYHLDPMAEELIVYQSKIYLTLRGAVRLANQHPQFEGLECVPASADERRAFRCAANEHLWVARVWRRDRRFPITGYGRCADNETVIGQGGALVANVIGRRWPQELAQKRAKHRALRDAFSLPLPGAPDESEIADPDGPRGAVLDGEAREVPEITPGQVEAIHAVVGELGWSDATYRARLQQQFGVRSSKALSRGQAAAFLEALAAEATGHAARPARAGEKPAGWAGPAVVDEAQLDAAIDEAVAAHAPDDVPTFFQQREERAPMAPPEPAVDVAQEATALLGGELQRGDPPTQRALDAYAAALSRANALGIDLAPYAINDPATITADALDALDGNLRAEIAANEPPDRLAGM